MAELVTPNTPRPSPYGEGRSGSGSGFGTTMNLYDRFKVEQAQQQALQETRQQARVRRHSKYEYKFTLSTRKKGTSLRVCFNPVTSSAITALERNVGQITDIPKEDVDLLIKALRSCRILVDVTCPISPTVLETVNVDAIRAEESARLELENKTVVYRNSSGLISEEMFQDLVFKHKLAKSWKDRIAREVMRVKGYGTGTVTRNGSGPEWPTQHARLSASSRILLRNVLSKDTLHETFVSLESLSTKVGKEVAEFLNMKNRDLDRKLVIQQIKDSIASAPAPSTSIVKKKSSTKSA